MQKIIKYELTEEEHKELDYKLSLLQNAIREEKSRLFDIKNKTHSENISYNTIEYASSLIYDITRLL